MSTMARSTSICLLSLLFIPVSFAIPASWTPKTKAPPATTLDWNSKSTFCVSDNKNCHLGAHEIRGDPSASDGGPGTWNIGIYDVNCNKVGYADNMPAIANAGNNGPVGTPVDSELPAAVLLQTLGMYDGVAYSVSFWYSGVEVKTVDYASHNGGVANNYRKSCTSGGVSLAQGAAINNADYCSDIPFDCGGFNGTAQTVGILPS